MVRGGTGAGDRLFRITPEVRTPYGNANTTPGPNPEPATPTFSVTTTPMIFGVSVPEIAGGAQQQHVSFINNSATLIAGAATNPTNFLDTGTAGYRLGGSTNWQSDIAELLVCDAQLTTAELNKVGSYLAGKYGIAASFTGDEIYWDNGSTDVTSPVSPPYPGNNVWSTPSHWRANNTDPMNQFPNDTLPGPTDRVNISLHDVPADPPVPANVETGDDLLVNSVRVGGTFGLGVGGDGILNIHGGTLTIADNGGTGTGGRLEIAGVGDRTGLVHVDGGTLNVGRDVVIGANRGSGTSTLTIDSGTLNVSGSSITVDHRRYVQRGTQPRRNRELHPRQRTNAEYGERVRDRRRSRRR